MPEIVYVLTNEAMECMVKIGRTIFVSKWSSPHCFAKHGIPMVFRQW